MANFPTSAPNLKTDYVDNVDDVMAANQNTPNDEVNAIASKIGTGSSTPTAGKVLKGTGTGTSSWENEVAGTTNILSNGNFINNSTNGYGGTPDDWTNSSANPVQGGFPIFTKAWLQSVIPSLADGDIEGLWALNEASGNATDASDNGYTLTDNNTVGSSDDGLMNKARDFEAGNSEYFSRAEASSGNLYITGSQTWFAFVKQESLPGNCVISLGDASLGSGEKRMFILDTGKVLIQFDGLSATLVSDVAITTGKWFFIAIRYNSSTNILDVFINGIKKSVSVTGTISSTWGNVIIGANYNATTNFFDGLIQGAGVLSKALTDDEVSALWWNTLGKKLKLRRATSDGYVYQTLPQSLVEELRGQDVSVTAKVQQDTASIAQVSLYDGTETASTTSATTGSFINIGATKTISSTASSIQVRAKVSTSDGNAWFKEIMIYKGGSLAYVWSPSKDDWARFSRALRGESIDFVNGYKIEGDLSLNAGAHTTTTLPKQGQQGYDTTNNRLYINQNGVVKYVAMT